MCQIKRQRCAGGAGFGRMRGKDDAWICALWPQSTSRPFYSPFSLVSNLRPLAVRGAKPVQKV